MMSSGYRIICFENGAEPVLSGQIEEYISYSYEPLMKKMLLAIRTDEYDNFYMSIYGIKKLLIRDLEQIEGRQVTKKKLNQILQDRVNRGRRTNSDGSRLARSIAFQREALMNGWIKIWKMHRFAF